MRNLFLALLLANLAFMAWQRWIAAPELAPYVAPDVPTIELASERASTAVDTDAPEGAAATEADGPAAAAAVEPASALPASSRCVSVGPFRELAQAAGAAANLRMGGYEPSQRAGEGDIWVGYWVYIDAIPSRDAADDILENLHANGITDAYIIPSTDTGIRVSLGVFSEIARAGNLRERTRELGYDPVIQDRTRRGTVYWVDLMLEGQESLDFDLLQTPGRILRLEQRPCEPGA